MGMLGGAGDRAVTVDPAVARAAIAAVRSRHLPDEAEILAALGLDDPKVINRGGVEVWVL